jgi:hypothetical protein
MFNNRMGAEENIEAEFLEELIIIRIFAIQACWIFESWSNVLVILNWKKIVIHE